MKKIIKILCMVYIMVLAGMNISQANETDDFYGRNTNYARLQDCMQKAAQGKELNIAFFGGSITQGSLASSDELTYAYKVYEWWKNNFPEAKFHYINGGIGGTTSYFGVARAVDDLLMYNPDVVVVDFSVNDDTENSTLFTETFEGLIRRILNWQSKPAVIVLNNVFYDTGVNMQEYHNKVADHYGVPHVSIKDTIYPLVKSGRIIRTDISPDGLHPNDRGHQLVADEIIKLLDTVKNMPAKENSADGKLPLPLTKNTYENAVRLNITNSMPKLEGFRADTEEKKGHLDFFKNGWTASKVGDKIHFDVTGSNIAIQYRKTIHKPAPVARAVIDGDEMNAVILDGNFAETWGDCLYLEPVLNHGENKHHTVDIEIISSDENIQTPFYLLSLIVSH